MTNYHIDPIRVPIKRKGKDPINYEIAWPENGEPHIRRFAFDDVEGSAGLGNYTELLSPELMSTTRQHQFAYAHYEEAATIVFELALEIERLRHDNADLLAASGETATENHKNLAARHEAEGSLRSLESELAAERALRVAAETAQIQSEKAQGYWYRRCCFSEGALQFWADRHEAREAIKAQSGAVRGPNGEDEERIFANEAYAHRVLAEMRKGELPNYEDVIRDRRQAAILAWAIRTFSQPSSGSPLTDDFVAAVDASSPEERAFRFLEEAVELVQAICDQVAYDEEGMAEATMEDASAYTYLKIMDRLWNRVIRTASKVWGKPVGKIPQEIGAVSVTLLALAERLGVKVATEERNEYARVLSIPKGDFQKRHQKKVDDGY